MVSAKPILQECAPGAGFDLLRPSLRAGDFPPQTVCSPHMGATGFVPVWRRSVTVADTVLKG